MSGEGQSKLKLSGNGHESKPLVSGGQLIRVMPTLVKRVKQHFHRLPKDQLGGADVEVLLGCNGFVWVGSPSTATNSEAEAEAEAAAAAAGEEKGAPGEESGQARPPIVGPEAGAYTRPRFGST